MKRPLTLYSLKPTVKAFDHAIREEALDDPSLARFDLAGEFDFAGRLYMMPVEPKEPSWAEFLRVGFGDFEATPTAMNRVVVVLQVSIEDTDRFYAATFGAGRFLLRTGVFEKKYGLRVALNAIYAGDLQDSLVPSTRLRQVGMTRVAKNTIHTRRQSNRDAAFQDFGVDLTSDLLGTITGVPGDPGSWGSRLSGADSLRVQIVESFEEIGDLCRRLYQARRREDYKVRFKRIDDIRSVPAEKTPPLEDQLLARIQESPEALVLAPPSLVDFDRVGKFRFSFDPGSSFDDLQLTDYLDLMKAGELDLTLDALKSHKVEALDDAGHVSQSWSVFETLDTELVDDKDTYLLVGGSFFRVSAEMMAELDEFVDKIEESKVVLPTSTFTRVFDKKKNKMKHKEESEGDYNLRAAAESDSAWLDAWPVRVRAKADPIEVCDLLTLKRQFVHVKRKFGSSSLSHLFAQGAISGDLFVRSDEYRNKIRTKLATLGGREQVPEAYAEMIPAFQDMIPAGRPDTSRYEIVYAIIGKWKNGKPSQRLPFFSKINLRRHASDLRAAGFKVTYSKIDLVAA